MSPGPDLAQAQDPVYPKTMSHALTIHDLDSISHKHLALETLAQITRIERKTFPASEAFDFSDQSLWRRKPNTHVLYATVAGDADIAASTSTSSSMAVSTIAKGPKRRSSTATAPSPAAATVIAYALYVRQRGTALLHKLCVAEPFRGQGVGRQLLTHVIGQQRSQRSGRGCLAVQLWVDEKREAARRLYGSCGFVEVEVVEDYYGPGRKGLRMVLGLEGDGVLFCSKS
ncbi:acetyltransferase [Histoplasma capsulatum var. duboisii H88]|uniref:Acetyltransferase n=2 Tax=Ajellomyces capsulatus TaxID=5037 RepID=A0A8A1LLS3_AJEC8|nr:acetyltransferase [Histoplasma capsulatum H143]QSS54410.1 acetyltransferase [Histoplasma capsulatum var. duboisii H88]